MIDYDSDEVIAEITDEMIQREQERKTGMFSGFDDNARKWTCAFIGAVFFFMFTGKMTNPTGLKILAVGVILIYFMVQGATTKRGELGYIECMIRIKESLKLLQKHPIGDMEQIPLGKIGIGIIGRKQWYEGKAFKRSYEVKIYDQFNKILKYYFAEVDIFTGDIITLRDAPEGVRGDETKDIKIMANYDMMVQKKRDQFLDKSYKI